MVLFKKRDDSGIPELPRLPPILDSNKERGLPSIPGSFNEDMNRNIIKSAINDEQDHFMEDNSGEGYIPSLPVENVQAVHEKFLPKEVSSEPSGFRQIIEEKRGLVEGPDSIFVRIDKFKSAKKEVANIKKGILDVEELISKINDIKLKEDNEIKEINLNLDNIKKKVGEIDSLVFDKV